MDPVVARRKETLQNHYHEIICRKDRRNSCLVGEKMIYVKISDQDCLYYRILFQIYQESRYILLHIKTDMTDIVNARTNAVFFNKYVR